MSQFQCAPFIWECRNPAQICGLAGRPRDPHDPLITRGSPFANLSDQKHNISCDTLRVSHGAGQGPVLKRDSLHGQDSEVHARKPCRVWCRSRLCALSIPIHPFQMSGSSKNESSHRSGGASDCEGSAASSHESELPDNRTPRRNKQIRERVWILRGEITTDLLHNDSASMDCDDDQDAKV
jgi:hypothetical protein